MRMGNQIPLTADHKYLGKRLRALRQKKNFTQEDLASKVGLSSVYISYIETGKRNITYDKILKLAKALEVSPSLFFE